MLKTLTIRNLAIIDSLELDFSAGFTVLTGETGAGKSILIDALGLAIGTRADAALVRAGQDKAEISASFDLARLPEAVAWLREQDLLDADEPGTLLIRRLVHAEGRTRAFVNGAGVNAGQLRELGECLIEIFGQSESQTLLRPDAQRRLLDEFGGHAKALDAVREAARAHADAEHGIERLRSAAGRDPAQLDFLRFQVRELEGLGLGVGELEQLEADHRRLAHAGRLLQEGGQAQEQLYGGEDSIYDRLGQVSGLLDGLVPLHEGFREPLELVDAAQSQLREAADAVRRQLERLDLDPGHLAELEARLSAIHDLARKHRLKPADLPEQLGRLQAQLDEVSNAASRLEQLEQEREQAAQRYRAAAATLSAERRKAGKRLGDAVTRVVRELGMPNAQFLVSLEPLGEDIPRAHGNDEVRFDFSANPGQPPRALAKVASGGELSRVSLALQVAGLQGGAAVTMIFDEVDAGISGGVAEVVGRQLRALGDKRQVLSVTHLAQVAAQGHAHFGIRKEVRAGQTYTRVRALEPAERVDEIARMQGGVEVSEAARSHARDLLQRAGRPG
ncbi:MAG TPA: DNA repair protein RecN [Solimonas sp.]|nr:DNA repair protein RecN [Solimonas sp.]